MTPLPSDLLNNANSLAQPSPIDRSSSQTTEIQQLTASRPSQLWCGCKELILAFVIILLFILIPFGYMDTMGLERHEYGPIGFILCWYAALTIFMRNWRRSITSWFIGHRDQDDRSTLEAWLRYSPLLVLFILFSYPFLKETLNPIGFWEAQANTTNTCGRLNEEMIHDMRENVIVAARKLEIGIGTTRELRDAKDALQLTVGAWESCVSKREEKIARAHAELHRLRTGKN